MKNKADRINILNGSIDQKQNRKAQKNRCEFVDENFNY